jgi:UDP-N-acetylmuramoylalanine--D-glutamate ligase
MNLDRFKNKKIAFLGAGSENRALFDFFLAHKLEAEFTICDSREEVKEELKEKYPKANLILGKAYDKSLDKFEIVFRIAGYPLFYPGLQKAEKAGAEITSPTKLFFELSPTENIIGVTGSKGKGPTSGLILKIIKTDKRKVFWGGNVGIPMFSFIDKLDQDSWVVLELSSFQLEDLDRSPKIAVMTNFVHEHLSPADPLNPNYHKSLADYWRAKTNIFKHQQAGDYLVANERLRKRIMNIASLSEVSYFAKAELKSNLVGEHNKENIAAAEMVAKILKIEDSVIEKAIKNFKGLEYRIEFVKEKKGIKYYNDSFATTPEATIVALQSFSEPIILLVGGADKGADFKKLAKEIKEGVKFVVLLHGRATPRIKKWLEEFEYPKSKMKLERDIKSAVKTAKKNAVAGDVVLLSTACASFGMFKNYKERGRLFNESI